MLYSLSYINRNINTGWPVCWKECSRWGREFRFCPSTAAQDSATCHPLSSWDHHTATRLHYWCRCVGGCVYVCVCVCVFVCVYLPSCSIQGLSNTHVVLSPYLYLSSFSFSWCTFCAIITSSFSPFQISILIWGKCTFFVSFKQIPFCNFFLCPLKFLASPFLLNIRSFLSVSSR